MIMYAYQFFWSVMIEYSLSKTSNSILGEARNPDFFLFTAKGDLKVHMITIDKKLALFYVFVI